ncbi:Signal peptidase [Floricoccus penangensis]|uniref:Signal peptidase n=1 Tax=Floricoccus penangensis TaxID=1859475 RepID=A0A9Q5JHG4_9LACT|nr:regulatory iron-sulfur-containing complex subunit RicT [Floricoccus penangensis]OFI47583.1 Signal peptidase [Floricoccus penangensis]
MIYELKFNQGQSNMFFSSDDEYCCQELVIAKTKSNRVVGKIVRVLENGIEDLPLDGQIISYLSDADYDELDNIEEDSLRAKKIVKHMVAEHELGMKIVEVSYTFDRKQLFISFVAEHRVDFRALLKDLADEFRVRIELRQIGVRDAAKIFGGLGPCGRPLCCTNFVGDFPVVSIKMAKNQALTLNQSKLSGLCGRLLCCLSYEDEFYREAKKNFPDYGDVLMTEEGEGKVIGMNIINSTVKLRIQNENINVIKDFSLSDVEVAYG